MIQRCHNNKITKLKDEQGWDLLDHAETQEVMMNLYKDLMREPSLSWKGVIDKTTRNNPILVTVDQNEVLLQPITLQEVEQAGKDM